MRGADKDVTEVSGRVFTSLELIRALLAHELFPEHDVLEMLPKMNFLLTHRMKHQCLAFCKI